LRGDIPNADIDALDDYWQVYPSLKKILFGKSERKGYSHPKVEKELVKQTIFNHPEFVTFSTEMDIVFEDWKKRTAAHLKKQGAGLKPKKLIFQISEDLLQTYTNKKLIDKYDIYQHLLNYWNDVMQDDCYLVAVDGWKAEPYRILIENKKKEKVDKGWACDLVPKELMIARYFQKEREALTQLESDRETIAAKIQEIEEEHGGDEGYFAELEKVNKASVAKRLKDIKGDKSAKDEIKVLETYLKLSEEQGELATKIKEAEVALDKIVLAKYATLKEADVKQLVVDDKWMTAIERSIKTELERISQRLTQRIRELEERYENPLPSLNKEVDELEKKVNEHLKKMGLYGFN
jgi:type I restriction enzyme M protein